MKKLLLSILSTNLVSGVNSSSIIPQAAKNQIAQMDSKKSANVEFGGGAAVAKNIPQPIVAEITRIGKESTVEATRTTFIFAAIFILLAFVSALFLPNKRQEDRSAAHTTTSSH